MTAKVAIIFSMVKNVKRVGKLIFISILFFKKSLTEEIKTAIGVLQNGGLIAYPTETFWAIGCDATNEQAVQKLLLLSHNSPSSFIECLVANDAMLERHVDKIPDIAFDIIDLATKPTTIVYDNSKGIAKDLFNVDNSVAIRVVSDTFCTYLIGSFKKPIVAAPITNKATNSPKTFKEIDKAILTGVDYVVNLHQENQAPIGYSIIRLHNDGKVKVIRE